MLARVSRSRSIDVEDDLLEGEEVLDVGEERDPYAKKRDFSAGTACMTRI